MNNKIAKAAFIAIGNELLSGKTVDKNLNFLAKELTSVGIDFIEARFVRDIEDEIVFAVNELREKFDYVFTSGGIGPTHDDITAESIAKAFSDKTIYNDEAVAILEQHYGKENLNQARLKMAKVPSKASLLSNSISSAPGFKVENVFVMAGVPEIFQAMVSVAKKELVHGPIVKTMEIITHLRESIIAERLEQIQNKYKEVDIGSYPSQSKTTLVFRSRDYQNLSNAFFETSEYLERLK